MMQDNCAGWRDISLSDVNITESSIVNMDKIVEL